MKQLRSFFLRLAGIFTKSRRERDMADELNSHLAMHTDDNVRAGMPPEEARRAAALHLGMESTKEAYRDRATLPFLEHTWQDVRFSLRQLAKNPGFTVTAVCMLALGTAASLAIFTFVDAALVRPLPYAEPGRLVDVTESVPTIPRANLSYFDYLDWKRLNTVFSSLDIYDGQGFLLTTPAGVKVVPGVRVSAGFFHTLGVAPELGRDFYSGEDQRDAPNAVILSYGAWQKHFSGRRDVLGQTVLLSGIAHTIVGILPRNFQFAPRGSAEFWTAFHQGPEGSCEARRSCHNLYGVARLKDGVAFGTALAEMQTIAKRLEERYPDSNRGQGASVMPLTEAIVGPVRPILLTLLGGAVLLLLIGWVNIASLLLVRSESRRREFAVRGAMGASRSRLVRQFLTESLVLAAAGNLLGFLLAFEAIRILLGLIPENILFNMPYLNGLHLGPHAFAFTAAVFVVTAVLLAVPPMMRMPSVEIRSELAEGSRSLAGTLWRRFGSNLVVVELAIAMVLLVGAGLLGKSFYLLLKVDLGFEPQNLATFSLRAPMSHYTKPEQQVALSRLVRERISSLPGVQAVGNSSVLPVSFNGNTDWIRIVGKPYNGVHNEVNGRDVSSDFFSALHVKLLQGRFFTEDDNASHHKVTIINRALAEKYFPGEDPIGKQFGNTSLDPASIKEIIGVVDDLREGPLDADIWPAAYYPYNQDPDPEFWVAVRTTQSAEATLPSIISAVHQIDPEIATIAESTMEESIHESQTAYLHRSSAWLVGGYAFLALLLGVVGLYGMIAYTVSQRTREIGIRVALGAQRISVYQLILKEAGWLTFAGVSTGLALALIGGTLIRKLLFGVASWDIQTLAMVTLSLASAAMLASFVPARRAASVNPVEALRAE